MVDAQPCQHRVFLPGGMFFRPRPFREFLPRQVRMLVVPFVFFFLLSYPFRVLLDLWDYRSLDAVRWGMVFDVFRIESSREYLYANVPLWFLMCLFMVQIFYWGLYQLKKWHVVMALFALWLLGAVMRGVPSPLMMNRAAYFIIFFGCGNLLGPWIVKGCEDRVRRWAIIGVAAVGLAASWIIMREFPEVCHSLLSDFHFMCYSVGLLALFSFHPHYFGHPPLYPHPPGTHLPPTDRHLQPVARAGVFAAMRREPCAGHQLPQLPLSPTGREKEAGISATCRKKPSRFGRKIGEGPITNEGF